MTEGHWFDEGIKILGWVLLMSAVFGAIASGGAEGLALLAAVVAIFALNWLISTLVRAGEGICKLGNATLEAISKIRITLPSRAPTKREIADWFIGDHEENERILDSAPLDQNERLHGSRQNQANLVDNINGLFQRTQR